MILMMIHILLLQDAKQELSQMFDETVGMSGE